MSEVNISESRTYCSYGKKIIFYDILIECLLKYYYNNFTKEFYQDFPNEITCINDKLRG